MLDRIIMDIIYMTIQISVIANYVIPKTVLPYSSRFLFNPFKIVCAKTHFQSLNQVGNIVTVSIHKEVEVVRENYPRLKFK